MSGMPINVDQKILIRNDIVEYCAAVVRMVQLIKIEKNFFSTAETVVISTNRQVGEMPDGTYLLTYIEIDNNKYNITIDKFDRYNVFNFSRKINTDKNNFKLMEEIKKQIIAMYDVLNY